MKKNISNFKKSIIGLIFLLFIGCSLPIFSDPLPLEIPLEDQEKLEAFCQYLIHNTTLGYTLCGEKPVAIETFPSLSKIPAHYSVRIFVEKQGYSTLHLGLKLFQKYSTLFQSENFIMRIIPEHNTLVLINKRETKKVIALNLDLFKKILSSDYTTEKLLEELCHPNSVDLILSDKIVFLGIILGYGKNNSIAFANKGYFQKLEKFELYANESHLSNILNPGFMVIGDGTNEKENAIIQKKLTLAK